MLRELQIIRDSIFTALQESEDYRPSDPDEARKLIDHCVRLGRLDPGQWAPEALVVAHDDELREWLTAASAQRDLVWLWDLQNGSPSEQQIEAARAPSVPLSLLLDVGGKKPRRPPATDLDLPRGGGIQSGRGGDFFANCFAKRSPPLDRTATNPDRIATNPGRIARNRGPHERRDAPLHPSAAAAR